ncbi:hypothetical protein [Ferruginibacter albus]|uniref:hypothetical protein n=1 Tax=Ferruginibacter albus TaxID=2875540 RepID=UPI001CC48522|nr:hypothetical protein [Ferruginibacter albus]UAY50656.1 hypothetical protein K9M53_08620 [Ferruginibacter albus]
MKRIFILICFLYSANSFGQQVSYNDLVGGHYRNSSHDQNAFSLYIKDSSHFMLQGERLFVTYTYKLDTTNHLLLALQMKKYNYKLKKWEYFKSEKMIKIISNNELIDETTNSTFKRIN